MTHEPPADSYSVPDLVCSFYLLTEALVPQPPPKVALCLGGAARTFSHHVVYRTWKQNFVDSFGADVTLFAYLKLQDERGSVVGDGVSTAQHMHTGTATNAELSAVLYALRHVGVPEEHVDIIAGNYSAPRPRCPNYSAKHDGTGVRDSAAYFDSLLGQIESRKKCMDMVVAHEARRGVTFDSIVYARPDLAWPFPMPPFCFHDFFQNRKKQDWIWWIRRKDAEFAFNRPHEDMYGCHRELIAHQTVEQYLFHHLPVNFFYPNGRGDHPALSGHIVRVPGADMGSAMCKQLVVPGIFPACIKDDAVPRGWNCAESLHGNPYNHAA